MITQFRVQNFKALRDVTLNLTRIHVLIGPNDSGKTSILEALAALCRSADHRLPLAFLGMWQGQDLVWSGKSDAPVTLLARATENGSEFEYTLACWFGAQGRSPSVAHEALTFEATQSLDLTLRDHDYTRVWQLFSHGQQVPAEWRHAVKIVGDALGGVQYYRWDPRVLALPIAPDSNRRFRMGPTGFGLALCVDEILGYDRHVFTRLEDRYKKIFPHVKSIKLIGEPAYRSPVDDPEPVPKLQQSDGKGLYFETNHGPLISASQASDGMLLVLAYLTILHLPRQPRVLLVEEPENGIHPKRLKDVLTILRDLLHEQHQTQVVLTTHSPYVVDLFSPEEVTLCTRQDDGTVSVHQLSASQTVRHQLDVFTLGEIWTSEGDEALVAAARPQQEPSQ